MPLPTTKQSDQKLERQFVTSVYLSLALACLCLTYAEFNLLPEIVFFAGVVEVLLVASFLAEGKWSLSNRAANVFGAVVAMVSGSWMVVQIMRPAGGPLQTIPWPTSMLPFLGPLLMLLLPAKLLRPKKIGDYWAVHGIGLVCVGLGCVLADDAVFGGLLLLYLLCGLWSLLLFFLYREHIVPNKNAERPPVLPRLLQIFRLLVPMSIVALVGFLYTPRSGNTWQLGGEPRRQMVTGINEDPHIDLNATGDVELNRDVAFEAYAEDNWNRPKLDLSPNQRWRGPVFTRYADGRWSKASLNIGSSSPGREIAAHRQVTIPPTAASSTNHLPDFGAQQYFVTVTVQSRIGPTPFLAVPMPSHPTRFLPVVQLRNDGRMLPFFQHDDTTLQPTEQLMIGRGRYKQVLMPMRTPDLSPDMEPETINREALKDRPNLPGLEEWTRGVLQRLAAQNDQLQQALTDLIWGEIRPENHELVARALERFLSSSGEYSYSLHLERVDPRIDPILDFLFNSKQGHCTRFATALTVMLKSVGIPCQIVLGFRGAESRGDGHYDIRQCHAHAWVEVWVSREEPRLRPDLPAGNITHHLLTLDPTPFWDSVEATQDASRRWWNSSDWRRDKLFKDLILNYSPEQRAKTTERLWEALGLTWDMMQEKIEAKTVEVIELFMIVSVVGMIGVVGVLILWQRHRRNLILAAEQHTAFHKRLLALLAGHGWRPAPGQTLREFAISLRGKLPERMNSTDLAWRIEHITNLFYRVRFGQQPLDTTETRSVQSDLDHLAAALALH
jgi:transglutaminase-like putative cysteine protease